MELKTIILHSEYEFRNFVISSSQDISHIIIFEDTLDCTNFFYCFDKNGSIIATKELIYADFSHIKEIYTQVAKKIHFSISNYYDRKNAIKLVSEDEKRCT